MLTTLSTFVLLLVCLTGFSQHAHSAPSELKIDQSQKKKTQDKYIRAAHTQIKHDLSHDEVRFTILNAALNNKGVKWVLEEDGEDYMILRWDYGETVIYSKVEFDKQYIQLKYYDSHEDFKCTNNVDGICYRNQNTDYYAQMKKLRTSIASLL